MDPDRQCGVRSLLLLAEPLLLVEADPHGSDEVRGEAVEPEILRVSRSRHVRGARLAGDIVAMELACAYTGAALDDVLHHVGHQPVVLRRDDPLGELLGWKGAAATAQCIR